MTDSWSFEEEERWYLGWSIAHGILAIFLAITIIPISIYYTIIYLRYRYNIVLVKRRNNLALHQIILLIISIFFSILYCVWVAFDYRNDSTQQWGLFGIIYRIIVNIFQYITDFSIFYISIIRYWYLKNDINNAIKSETLKWHQIIDYSKSINQQTINSNELLNNLSYLTQNSAVYDSGSCH